MAKKGRKPLTESARKIAQVKVSFTSEQIAKVLNNASRARLKPAEYVAQAALQAEVKERLSKEALVQIKGLNRLNITLNQILVKINSDNRYYCQEQLLRTINELTITRRLLVEKMVEGGV